MGTHLRGVKRNSHVSDGVIPCWKRFKGVSLDFFFSLGQVAFHGSGQPRNSVTPPFFFTPACLGPVSSELVVVMFKGKM